MMIVRLCLPTYSTEQLINMRLLSLSVLAFISLASAQLQHPGRLLDLPRDDFAGYEERENLKVILRAVYDGEDQESFVLR